MEIGTEISKKIRAAIKGKLQELGAYVDEELPDYIMVMVANKKTSQQMSDDLSLFLGNNTIKFTVWLHGVLEKLRSVAVEPASLRPQLYSDTGTSSGKSEWKGEESKGLAVSSSRSDRTEARVSSSAYEHRRVSSDKNSSSRLTSTVKPLMDPPSSEAVIDIKPELDDDLIGEDPVDMGVLPGRLRGSTSSSSSGGGGRASAQIYRPPQGRSSSGTGRSADAYRSSEGSSGSHRPNCRQSVRLSRCLSKRKAPVVSSVVRVNQAADGGRDSDEEEEDDDEEDEGYGVKNLSSRVSLPSKPERKPSLPPAKQANKNLLLRAMSEAQISINKTAAYPPIPQRQTVPVAPRTRSTSDEMNAAIQLVQEHLHGLVPRGQSYTPSEPQPPRQLGKSPSCLIYHHKPMLALRPHSMTLEVAEGSVLKPFDTRSFIVRRPELGEELVPVRSRLGQLDMVMMMNITIVSISKNKNIVVSGLDSRPSSKFCHPSKSCRSPVSELGMETEEEEAGPVKRQKVLERCKFWPVCKSGDECVYHHPTTQCKTFPSCKFGDKCLFVHPNCKFDGKCSKPDCPFTHVSRRGPSPYTPPVRPDFTFYLMASTFCLYLTAVF
uniref:Zinc finger CCCH domain-containing protein 14 n=1 Tax=Hucho hucho TaxID=62062 RepID=A0A4W5NCN1_9TELE